MEKELQQKKKYTHKVYRMIKVLDYAGKDKNKFEMLGTGHTNENGNLTLYITVDNREYMLFVNMKSKSDED